MSNQWVTKNGRTAKRGLFVDGVWYCDCDTRLPAEKFQVKNGGKNHGRWFFTCQNGQAKRCGFFLWSTDAKVREEAAVLHNSRTEPGAEDTVKLADGGRLRSAPTEAPQTPKKQIKITQAMTPTSKIKSPGQIVTNKLQNSSRGLFAEESFEWSSSDEAGLVHLAEQVDPVSTDDESPRKVAKLSRDTSSRKAAVANAEPPSSSWSITDDLAFATPSTSRVSGNESGLLSPGITPAHVQRQLFPYSKDKDAGDEDKEEASEKPMGLALEVLSLLSPVRTALQPAIEQKLITLLNNHEFRARGTAKGRDLARAAISTRDLTITELKQRIGSLEAEKERQKTVINHLKMDIAKSPKKPRRPRDTDISNG